MTAPQHIGSAGLWRIINGIALDPSPSFNVTDWASEADLSKFVQVADTLIEQHLQSQKPPLKTIRKQAGLTQKELSNLSGVSLRMIQAYEQGDQDIMKAEAQTVFALSRVLGCKPEVL